MINSVSSVSFKSYVPVQYFALNPKNDKYVPVIKRENIRKCNSFVVRNLNGTAKNTKNDEFVKFFSAIDSDYRRCPKVHSVYDIKEPVVHLITGADTDTVKELAKPIGIAKGHSLDKVGHTKTFEASSASNQFFKNVQRFIRKNCKQLKSENRKDLVLKVYFHPKYKKNNELKGFEYVGAKFTEQQ